MRWHPLTASLTISHIKNPGGNVRAFIGLRLTSLLLALAVMLAPIASPFLRVQAQVDADSLPPDLLRGAIVIEEDKSKQPSINPDELKELERGTPLEMNVTTALSSGVSVSGDEFFGKLNKDYVVDGKVVLPRGTLVHAQVETLVQPKRAGRNGYVTAKFDYLITPDGREIPIEGKYSNKDNGLKAAAKVVGRSAGYTLAGGVVGALMVVKYGGLAAITATEGYALAGGAAIGGALGLGTALITKGKNAFIPAGSEIKVHLKEDLVLPTMNLPTAPNMVTLDGLDVDVLGMRVDKDPFGEPTELTLTLDVNNKTPNTFSSFDICLEDELGECHYPSVFGDTGLWFRKLLPNTHVTGNISFNVDNPKLQHWIVFYRPFTREPVARISVVDSLKTARKGS